MKISQNSRLGTVLYRFLVVIFLVGSFAAQSQVQSLDNSAAAWLNKMAEAKASLNYRISFALLKNGVEVQPYVWRHAVNADGQEIEHLMLLNGPDRQVIRIGQQVSYFEPNDPPFTLASGFIDGPMPNTLLRDPLSLSDSYDFFVVGKNRISGRAAQQIRIVSKDKSRFGWNLWLDQDTGLILKLHMIDSKGRPLEQIQVTEIQVTPEPDPFFESIDENKLPDIAQVQYTRSEPLNWKLDFVPVGMEPIKQDIHRLPQNGEIVQYMMLSDGLIDVSVYLQSAQGKGSQNDILGSYESSVYLTRQQGNVLVTVIGKLPPQTANAIASSVSVVQPQ